MFVMHGAAWLVVKAEGPVAERARRYGSLAALAVIILFALGGWLLWRYIDGYAITSPVVMDGPSNPLLKTVEKTPGQWFANYSLGLCCTSRSA